MAHLQGRIIILCFDGTRNEFETNSNVVRFFRALKKDDKQIVYYSAGIGTYNKSTFSANYAAKAFKAVISMLDAAIALNIDDRVKDGYRFIVQNYQPGDRICVFGYSRGAHTARIVSGMIYKVGILHKENIQHVDLAFSIYITTGYNGYKLSQEFKRRFTPTSTHQASVYFVGVWDTVSAVGIIPEVHPYTSVNYAVKKFRHALALDERRARFYPSIWNDITLARSHELDMEIPVPDMIVHTGKLNRDDFVYKPPDRDFADVKEVWFKGTHTEIGGGSDSLSLIPLRWMIKECIMTESDIIFDLDYLQDDLDFNFVRLLKEIGDEREKQNRIIQYNELKVYRDTQWLKETNATEGTTTSTAHAEDDRNKSQQPLLQAITNAVKMDSLLWDIIDYFPHLHISQDSNGDLIRQRMGNFKRSRFILRPVYQDKVLVHSSVKDLISVKKCDEPEARGYRRALFDRIFQNRSGIHGYTPSVFNWKDLEEENVIEYID